MKLVRALSLSALAMALGAGAVAGQTPTYHVVHSWTLGGDGGWDYLAVDTAGNRLFIGRQDRIMVVSLETGALLDSIPGLHRAHGVAFDYAAGHGFATSGADSTVTMFDLGTLKVLGRTHAAEDDDGILFDPVTKHIFTMNGDAGTASVIDGATGRLLGSVPLGGKPEFGVSGQNGMLYINLADRSEVAEVDARAMRVVRHWPLAPCEGPSGLAIDVEHQLLFSGCRSGVMAISDARAGKLITTVPIGRGVDACRFDAGTHLAFASNGDGTITVIREVSPDSFAVAQTVTTKRGARTMELDPRTHRLYTVTADFGPEPPRASGQRFRRPPIVPGTFALMVLEQ
jgi:DNA-binding beta-propeller fold protein YncE